MSCLSLHLSRILAMGCIGMIPLPDAGTPLGIHSDSGDISIPDCMSGGGATDTETGADTTYLDAREDLDAVVEADELVVALVRAERVRVHHGPARRRDGRARAAAHSAGAGQGWAGRVLLLASKREREGCLPCPAGRAGSEGKARAKRPRYKVTRLRLLCLALLELRL